VTIRPEIHRAIRAPEAMQHFPSGPRARLRSAAFTLNGIPIIPENSTRQRDERVLRKFHHYQMKNR
jgi:hypothetical protein